MLKRLRHHERGRRIVSDRDLALNLSFVLHERSDSHTIKSAVRAGLTHHRALHRRRADLAISLTGTECTPTEPSLWLTATIGLPHLLADALETSPDRVIAVDSDESATEPAPFFRAPATLVLPDRSPRCVGVAALILRPDRRTSQLVVEGIYDWPADRNGALRSLERLIQAHAGQWTPRRALWVAPAETLLASEVY